MSETYTPEAFGRGITVYVGECPKCFAQYEWDDPNEEPKKHGYFCPECKKKGYTLLGVVHFDKVLR